MRRKMIETGYELLIIMSNHLLMIGFGMAVIGLFPQESHCLWLWALMGILPAALYGVRIGVHNFFLFFALHLLFPAILIFLPLGVLQKVIALVITIVYVVWSIRIRLKSQKYGEEMLAPMFVICAFVGFVLLDNLQAKRGWESIYLCLAILYIAGYYLYCFINQYLLFLRVNESSAANIPEQEIFHSGMKQSLMFIAGGVAVLFLTANIGWVSYILSLVGKVLVLVLRTLISMLPTGEKGETAANEMQSMQPGFGMPTEDTDPSRFWIIMERILMVAGVAFIIGLLLFLIIMGLKYLWKTFYTSVKTEEKKMQSGIDIRETCVIEKNKKTTPNWLAFLNSRERVRKIYRKQVLKHKADIIGDYNVQDLEYMTAKECCEKISDNSKISADNLKKVYEKARYSAEDISAEDMKLLKTAAKQV